MAAVTQCGGEIWSDFRRKKTSLCVPLMEGKRGDHQGVFHFELLLNCGAHWGHTIQYGRISNRHLVN